MRVLWYLKGFQYGDMSCCPWPYKHHTLIRVFVNISILGVLGCTQCAHKGVQAYITGCQVPFTIEPCHCARLFLIVSSAFVCWWLVGVELNEVFSLQFWTCSPKQTGHHNWTELSSIRICLTVEVGGYYCSSYLLNNQSLSPSRAVETFQLP